MPDSNTAVIGVDLGTGGARAIAVSLLGQVLAEAESRLPAGSTVVDGPRVEQDPRDWSTAVCTALRTLARQLPPGVSIAGIAADATSGTFVLMDGQRQALTRGVMYNDQRATETTPRAAAALSDTLGPYGIRMAPSFALPKILHLIRTEPETFSRCRHVVHQTDWIVGLLTGRYDVTDISTALKTGADPGTLEWPTAIGSLGVPMQMLPRIVTPGTPVGEVTPEAAQLTGLPMGTPVVAGCTDGTAGCLASGARSTGDLNVTLGTTLVFKALAKTPLLDPDGVLYNHRHPSGGFLPGAASSTGGEWIEACFAGADPQELAWRASDELPTGLTVYPLVKQGERFPFVCPTATGFGLDSVSDPACRFAAGLEAVAYLERMGVERLENLGLPIGPNIYATGGGAKNEVWTRVRASVVGRTYLVPRHAGCAMGAAVLAATPVLGHCEEAIARLVRTERQVEPLPRWCDAYNEGYQKFLQALDNHGYLRGAR